MPFDLESATAPEAPAESKGGFDLSSAKEITNENRTQTPSAQGPKEEKAGKVLAEKKPGYWDQVTAGMKRDAKSAATAADMVIDTFGGLAGSIASIGAEAQTFANGATHKEAGKKGVEFGREVAEKLTFNNFFSRKVGEALGEGEELTPSKLQEVMGKINEQIDKKGGFIEDKTHGIITKEDVQIGSGFLMNLMGAKGIVRAGTAGLKAILKPKEAAKAGAPAPEADPMAEIPPEAPKPPPGGDPSKPKVDFKAFHEYVKEQREAEGKMAKPDEEPPSPAKQKMDYQAWKKHLEETAKTKADEAADAQQVKAAADPMNKARPKEGQPIPESESGKATPEQMWNVAALSLGAAAGAYLDPENPIVGAFKGLLLSTAATVPGAKAVYKVGKSTYEAIRGTSPPGDDVRATPLIRERDGAIALGALRAWRGQMDVRELVPKAADRAVLAIAIDEGKVQTLPPKLQQAAQVVRKLMVDAGNRGLKAGVLKGLVDNYITHIVETADRAKAMALFNSKLMGGSSITSPFAKARTIPTIKQLKAAGIKLKTEDAAEILGIYLRSIEHAIANKNFASQLQMTKLPGGLKGLMAYPLGKAPKEYVDAGIPGVRVHPDLEASVKYMFEAKELNGIAAAGIAFNTAIKRMEVMNPLFHTRSLLEARLGSTWNIFKPFGEVAKFISPRLFGNHAVLEQLRRGGPGNGAERALKAGLQASLEGEESIDADIRGGFYKAMASIQKAADKHIGPIAGVPLRAINSLNHGVDNMMWGRVHTGFKLVTFLAESEKLLRNAGKRGKFMTADAADKIAADMENMRYGGLNWHMLAEEINNRFLRSAALQLFSPKGRAGLGVTFFAPDWNVSTLMAFMATFQKGSGPRGLWQPTTLADLARQQLIRSGLYYMAVANALNYHYSGHFIWDNGKDGKNIDWTYIDRGDGTKNQIAKHFAEPFHAMMHPGQFAINKLGVIPSEILDQVTGREYNTLIKNKRTGKTELSGPPMEDRTMHALKRLAPIGSPDLSQGLGQAAWGLAGMQVYGKTTEQARAARKAKREQAFREKLKKLQEQKSNEQGQQGGQR